MSGGGGGHDPFSSFFGDFFGGGHSERDDQTPKVGFFWVEFKGIEVSCILRQKYQR